MSNSIFPTLTGLQWDIKKRPRFSTIVQRSASGKEIRSALMSYPLWEFELSYDVLRAAAAYTELQTLMGFFNQMLGSYDTFLYDDPSDDSVTDQSFGTGDGATASFQLLRTLGGFVEPIQNVHAITNIKVNGATIPAGAGAGKYTINSTGIVTFGTVPAMGYPITWTGTFYFRVRFLEDLTEFNNFVFQLWENKKLGFVSVKL